MVRRHLGAVPGVTLAGAVLAGVAVVARLLRYGVAEDSGEATAPLPLRLLRVHRGGGVVAVAHAQTPGIGSSGAVVVAGSLGVSLGEAVSDGVSLGVTVSDGVSLG